MREGSQMATRRVIADARLPMRNRPVGRRVASMKTRKRMVRRDDQDICLSSRMCTTRLAKMVKATRL
jgi:hypothetical protein